MAAVVPITNHFAYFSGNHVYTKPIAVESKSNFMKAYSFTSMIVLSSLLFCVACKQESSFAPPKTLTPPIILAPEIIGGENAKPEDAPWQVAIINTFPLLKKPLKENLRCGGSIIDQSWILTACHCFSINDSPKNLMIFYGSVNLQEINSNNLIAIDTIIPHRDYNYKTLENDIALIKLAKPIPLNTIYPKSIKLPYDTKVDDYIDKGEKVIVTGWGDTNPIFDSTSDTLKKVSVPLVKRNKCKDKYALIDPLKYTVTDSMLCAGYDDGGKDACQGDSGGPMFVKMGNNGYLIGIVSWGLGCAVPFQYGVYTDVSKYLGWIQENTGTNL